MKKPDKDNPKAAGTPPKPAPAEPTEEPVEDSGLTVNADEVPGDQDQQNKNKKRP